MIDITIDDIKRLPNDDDIEDIIFGVLDDDKYWTVKHGVAHLDILAASKAAAIIIMEKFNSPNSKDM